MTELRALLELPINFLKFLLLYVAGIVLWLRPSWFKRRKSVENEVILVTGAGSGLGRARAIRLAARGAKLVLWDLHTEQLERTRKMIESEGGRAWCFVSDVSDRKAVKETARKVRSKVGSVTILINNAGIAFGQSFKDLTEDAIEKTLDVNALAHFWTCKAFMPDMIASNKGHLVCVSSLAGLVSKPNLTDYCASKHALMGFMESLRQELRYYGHNGIKTTVVCPYFFASGLYRGSVHGLVKGLTVDQVADAALLGILTEESLCVIPWWFEIFVRLWSLTPSLASDFLSTKLGIYDMDKDCVCTQNIATAKKQ